MAEHRSFIMNLENFKYNHRKRGLTRAAALELCDFMESHCKNHILERDILFVPYLREKNLIEIPNIILYPHS